MYLDKNLELADAVSIAAAAGTAIVGSSILNDYAGEEPNSGRNLFLVVTVATPIVSAGAATIQFRLLSDAQDPVVAGGTQHAETGAIPYAELNTAGRVVIPLPEGPQAWEAYIGLAVTTAGATTSAGAINAFISTDAERWRAYTNGGF